MWRRSAPRTGQRRGTSGGWSSKRRLSADPADTAARRRPVVSCKPDRRGQLDPQPRGGGHRRHRVPRTATACGPGHAGSNPATCGTAPSGPPTSNRFPANLDVPPRTCPHQGSRSRTSRSTRSRLTYARSVMTDRRPRFALPTRRLPSPRPRSSEPAPEVSMEARPEDVAAPVEVSVVDSAIYVDGERPESPTTVAETSKLLHDRPGGMAWIGLFRPDEVAAPAGRRGVRPARGRRRGRDRRPPAAQAGTLRRNAVRRAPCRDVPRRSRGGRIRRDPRLRRQELRPDGSPQPHAGPGRRPTAHGERPGAARARAGGRPVRDPRQRRRRLRAGRRRTPEGHRGDRGPGLQGRPDRLPPHLRAVRRGHRVPAVHAAAPLDARGARGRASRSTARTRSCSATSATSPTTPRS